MNVIARFILVLIISSVAMSVVAADPEPQMPTTPPAPAAEVNKAEVFSDPNDAAKALEAQDLKLPMMNEIRVVMDVSRGEVSELALRAANTTDSTANQAIQQEISAIKLQTELDILAIQVRYARSAGNVELAERIEASIAAIISPPAPTAPAVPRPAPGSQN